MPRHFLNFRRSSITKVNFRVGSLGNIKLIQEDLKRLEQFSKFTFDEMANDWIRWSVLEWTLVKIIGRAIDINHHLLAELAGKDYPPPKDYKESFLFLPRINALPQDFINRIAESAGFRNKVIHEYNEIDKSMVFQTVGEAIEQYLLYCKYILEFLDQEKGK